MSISRPALRYYGGKWRLAPWIISHFPRHAEYVEPFAGALSVLLQKQPAPLEVANDIEGRVVNFFQVLREQPDELVRLIRLTPWHEGEYMKAYEPSNAPLEDARRFWTVCWMSYQGGPGKGTGKQSGFRFSTAFHKRPSHVTDGIRVEHLYLIAARLKEVQFLQRDGIEVIRAFASNPNTLFYVDPPYPLNSRSNRRGYTHDAHEDLFPALWGALFMVQGFVVVSGYPHPVYDVLEEAGWRREETSSVTTSGNPKTECVWLSPKTVKALERERLPLFAFQESTANAPLRAGA